MRWERLFEELEASAAEADRLGHHAEIADRTRRERSRVQLMDRLLAAEGTEIELRIAGAGVVRGIIHRVGGQWVLLTAPDGTTSETVVPTAALLAVTGLGRRAMTRPPSSVASRLGLAHVVRGLSRDRSTVALVMIDGHRVWGAIDGVGADHLDLTPRVPGESPNDAVSRPALVVPFHAVATITRTV